VKTIRELQVDYVRASQEYLIAQKHAEVVAHSNDNLLIAQATQELKIALESVRKSVKELESYKKHYKMHADYDSTVSDRWI